MLPVTFSRTAVVLTLTLGLAIAPACVLGSGSAAAADDTLPAPTGEVLLTISGAIATTNDGDSATFDLDMLSEMEQIHFETSTIWTEGKQTFTGVSLGELLDRVGAEGSMISATAINDYAITIPQSDWVDGGPIVAYLNNGEPMSVRDKGPLWVVYPYDSDPRFQTEVIYSRSIWQLDRITVAE